MKSQKIISVDPSENYKFIGEVAISSHDEIKNKVAEARQAQKSWGALSFSERNSYLKKLYDIFLQRKNEIGQLASKEMGMPASVRDQIDLDAGLRFMRGYIENVEQWLAPKVVLESDVEIHEMFFEPRGIVAVISPWNFPFSNFIWGVMQNLVVGNTVVLKHSEECVLTAKLLEDIVVSAGLPDGVFNQVYGDGYSVGQALVNSDIDLIHFTGSTGVGKQLYKIAAQKFIPIVLELGGSAPGIVFEDADMKMAIESIYFNRFVNSGQTCDGLKRLVVERRYFHEVVSNLKKLVLTKKLGPSSDTRTDIGPLVAERQVVELEAQVADAVQKGAKIIMGGKRPANLQGAYYEPTIITEVSKDMRIWKEEVFGPVLPVVVFDTEEEAVALANDTEYGLGAYVYTQDSAKAMRVSKLLQTGNVSVNDASYVVPEVPFGGCKNSGLGREHGKIGLRELCNVKVIAIKK